MRFTLEQIQEIFNDKEYHFFDKNKPYSLNIIGIRSKGTIPSAFDDWLYLIYRDENLDMQIYEFSITTDPGAYWLRNSININGTAILVPGQYYGSHAIGKHQGKYEALKQNRPVRVWRDNTGNTVIDKEGKVFEGIFGINIHRSSANGSSNTVEKWSAGCQVFQNVSDFNFFMRICRKASEIYGNSFTYTLLEEDDFS